MRFCTHLMTYKAVPLPHAEKYAGNSTIGLENSCEGV